jgi:hypothetical protein
MFRRLGRVWHKGNSRAARLGRLPARNFRPALEALEVRRLLSFGPPVPYNIGTQPSPLNNSTGSDGVTTGDFRGIGLTDLAVVHTVDKTLNILLNNGNGTFQPAVSYPCPNMELGATWVTAADLNGDGILDLAVLGNHNNSALDGVIDIFLANGDGTFQPAVSYSSGPGSRGGIAVADFNGDGLPDLAVADFNYGNPSSDVGILFNNGNGTFQAPVLVPVFQAARSVTVGDFNGDGIADLAVADGYGANDILDPNYPAGVTILLGHGDGTFTTAGQYNSPATPGGGTINPEFVITGDLRNKGITDVIVCDYDHNLNVFLGNGDGTFQPAVAYDTGEYPRTTAVVDVNGDGIPDLVVCNIGNSNVNPPEAGSVAVLLGNGDGTFQDAIQYTPFKYPGWLAVADFNGDGLPDVAVTRVQDGHSVNVMLNEPDTLTATGTTIQATAGQDFAAVVASFTDAGPNPGQATDYKAVINWGDGTPLSTGGVSVLGDGTYEVAASHKYAAAGSYSITITITDTRDPSRVAGASSDAEVSAPGSPGFRLGDAPPWAYAIVAGNKPFGKESDGATFGAPQ